MKKSQYYILGSFTALIIIILLFANYWKLVLLGCFLLIIIYSTLKNLKKIELEDDDKNNQSEDSDGWERTQMGEDTYRLTKTENGIKVFKYYDSGKLDKYDLVKNKEELEKAIEEFTIKSYAFISGLKEKIGIRDKRDEIKVWTELHVIFWKIYNSYSNFKNMPPDLFNTMAYLLYEGKSYEEGINFAEKANHIKERSDYLDTMGEGHYLQQNYLMAFLCFSKALNFDQKNKRLNEDHLCNFIRASIKTENFKSAENGIHLLKDNFEDNKEILEFEKQLKDLNIKSEQSKIEDLEEKKGNEKLFNFKKVNRKDHDTIDVDWLSNIKPIYIDTGNTHLQHDVLYSENNDFIFLNTLNQDTALDVVKTIIEINGGIKEFYKYTKHELDEITDYGGVEYICCYDCNSFRISCLKIISVVTFEVRVERVN